MAGMSVKMDGMKQIIAAANANEKVGNYLSQALYSTAAQVLKESKKIVPWDTRVLQTSGTVERPNISRGRASVEISYGGSSAPYALFVHEDPDATHKPGRTYKYLETPFLAAKPTFVLTIKRYFATYLKRGR